MKRLWLLVVLGGAAALGWWIYQRRTAPPEAPFARVTRATVISTVTTNGNVEPSVWAVARAEREGIVEKVLVERGGRVQEGAPLVELDAAAARTELTAAQARIAQAQAELDALARGGTTRELAEIENGLAKARLDLDTARREAESLKRLEEKKAATRREADSAMERVQQIRVEIESLERKRTSLVAQTDRAIAQGKLKESQAAAAAAQRRIDLSTIRAPIGGTVYELEPHRGDYLAPGALVARVGRMEQVRVNVYVDEPELGRVGKGMPVTITWDAKPGQTWKGEVDKVPTQVVTLGTRHVGEVTCLIANPQGELLPGTNVNVAIRSKIAENAITIPKESVRREASESGVFVLASDNRLSWRKVKLGVSSVTRTQVLEGVNEGEAVALPVDMAIRDGQQVKPVYP